MITPLCPSRITNRVKLGLVCTVANLEAVLQCLHSMLQWLDEIATDAKVPLHLWAASHYGGHRYAGNCVVYPTGDWFGMLNSKEDVQQMVEALTDNQPLRLQEHWRGRIRLSKEQQIEALKQFGEEAA
ncbi:Thioredoxin-like fold, partial [Globisporangium splendens]